MKKITPLVAVLSLVFFAVIIALGIMLITSTQRNASVEQETTLSELEETKEATDTPIAELLTSTPSPAVIPSSEANSGSAVQIDTIIHDLYPELYTYNEILVDDGGVQVRETRYYSKDNFVILTERMAEDKPLPQGEEILFGIERVVLVKGLEGEVLLTADTLQDGISRPALGGSVEVTQEPQELPEVIEYTDGLMIACNVAGGQMSVLTNLPEHDLRVIASMAIESKAGRLEKPEMSPMPRPDWFEYPDLHIAYSYSTSELVFDPLQPHYLPETFLTGQDEDEIPGAVAVGSADGSSVELQLYNVATEEFLLIRQRIPEPDETLDPFEANEIIELNGQPAAMVNNPECNLTVSVPDVGIQYLICTDSWSLNWFAEGLRLEVIGNNIPKSEGILIANGLQLD